MALKRSLAQSPVADEDEDTAFNGPFQQKKPINVNFVSALVFTYVRVYCLDGHKGTGVAYGFGPGGQIGGGILEFNSWEELMSAENSIMVTAIGATLFIKFKINGKPVAKYTGYGSGSVAFAHFGGTFNWSST